MGVRRSANWRFNGAAAQSVIKSRALNYFTFT